MRRYRIRLGVACAVGVFAASRGAAQTVAQRVDAVRDGVVLMAFAARPGVCGNGSGSIWTRNWMTGSSDDSRRSCFAGPVRVSLGRADNTTVSVRVYVGGAWRASGAETDLGTVPASDAARFLVRVAHTIGGRSAGDAVSGAALADSANVGLELLTLVRDANAPLEARRQALYWAGQLDLSTQELVRVYGALEPTALREHLTFVLSQRRDDPAVEKLIDIAQHDASRDVRRQAMYWLGQTNDPRAVKFLRDIVTR
jgi:hypothetical protein